MSSSSAARPNKKRALESSTLVDPTLTPSWINGGSEFVLQHQIDSLQAELDHERSLRLLDQKRAKQEKQRLEKQVEFAVEEADEAKGMLDQLEKQSETMTEQLRLAKNKAIEELRECQFQLEQQYDTGGREEDLWENKYYLAEKQLEAKGTECKRLQEEVSRLLEEHKKSRDVSEERSSQDASSPVLQITSDDAPPSVMKELNRVRVRQAEVECENRQLTRAKEDMQKRTTILLREKEEGMVATKRLPTVEAELRDRTRELDMTAAETRTWKEFANRLFDTLNSHGSFVGDPKTPPSVSSVTRLLDSMDKEVADAEMNVKKMQDTITALRSEAGPNESKIRELETRLLQEKREQSKMHALISHKEEDIASAKNKQVVLEHEVESLRSLIKTYDALPLASKDDPNCKFDSNTGTLQVQLSSVKERLTLVESEKSKLKENRDNLEQNKQELEKEIDRIKEKFGKLRDALMAEKAKVDTAERRANEAESLAGKGSFNPQQTRVLHLRENPLTEALRDEIQVLKRQLEASQSDRPAKAAADPEKLNKRLKENFKEQISVFREGVYLMTGFKVDMLPGTERPTFRVRSVFSEQESDQLLLKWPKGEEVSSLDILNTDLAKVLSQTPSYDYMTKFQSLPAFLASVQLSLFEKQTMMM